MRTSLLSLSFAALLLGGCTDDSPVTGTPEPEPQPAPLPIGVYDFYVTGIGTPDMKATASRVDIPTGAGGASAALNPAGSGLILEVVSRSGFTEGNRGDHLGQRYVTITYRVRNATGAPLSNVTFIPVTAGSTLAGSPFTSIRLFDDSHADPLIANTIVPTGFVSLGAALELTSPVQDVLQVFEEAEVAAVTLPVGITGIFPYGFVVSNPSTPNSRTLPASADPNQFDGVLTLAFRIPLQKNDPGTTNGETKDIYSFGIRTLAVQDTETRMTESIEEGQDSAAVRRLRARATALGATTVTVLAGSPATDPAVPDYPGQRQICTVRTAGTAGSPISTITRGGPFAGFMLLRPGESMDPCTAYFRTGTPGRPATNVAFPLHIVAVDRYGNVKTLQRDTMRLETGAGSPPATYSPNSPLVSGETDMTVTYSDYGNSTLYAVGRRVRTPQPVLVAGVTRTWTAGAATTNWFTGGNWLWGAVPMSLDSVYIPAAAPFFPTLTANASVQGVTVENGATLGLAAFDLTAGGNVSAGLTGGITNTTGRLVLTGIARTLQGRVPRLRVTGTYSLTGNVNARAPLEVSAGRLTSGAFRIQAESN